MRLRLLQPGERKALQDRKDRVYEELCHARADGADPPFILNLVGQIHEIDLVLAYDDKERAAMAR